MEFKAAKCPSCHGQLMVPDNKDFVECNYCGTNIKVRDAIVIYTDTYTSGISRKSKTENLFYLAEQAFKAGNYKEAYDYYNKILESDTSSPAGWYGKAKAAGYLSTPENNRLDEAVSHFKKAVEYSEAGDTYVSSIGSQIIIISARLHTRNKAIGANNLLNAEIIINALEYAYALEKNIEAAKWIVAVCDSSVHWMSDYKPNEKGRFKNTDEFKSWIWQKNMQYEKILTEDDRAKGVVRPNKFAAKNRQTLILTLILVFIGIAMLILYIVTQNK